jgi:hypothetical protein
MILVAQTQCQRHISLALSSTSGGGVGPNHSINSTPCADIPNSEEDHGCEPFPLWNLCESQKSSAKNFLEKVPAAIGERNVALQQEGCSVTQQEGLSHQAIFIKKMLAATKLADGGGLPS